MTYMLYLSKKKKTVSEHQFAIHPPFAADEGSHKDVVHSAQLDDLIPSQSFQWTHTISINEEGKLSRMVGVEGEQL